MKVKDLMQVLNTCDPDMEVFGDVHDGLWKISKAEVIKWYNDEDLEKYSNGETTELKEEPALCLKVDCGLSVYMP